MQRDGNTSLSKHRHERAPLVNTLDRGGLSIIAQQRLFHNVEFSRPRKHAGELSVIQRNHLYCIFRMR